MKLQNEHLCYCGFVIKSAKKTTRFLYETPRKISYGLIFNDSIINGLFYLPILFTSLNHKRFPYIQFQVFQNIYM